MGSFAIWNSGEDDGLQNIEIHLNLWWDYSVKENAENAAVLDIGIMLHEKSEASKEASGCSDAGNCALEPNGPKGEIGPNYHRPVINAFVPFSIDESNCSDLGAYLKEDTTRNAIFNENWGVKTISSKKYFTVLSADDRPDFYVYTLDISNDMAIDHSQYSDENGTVEASVITIDVNKLTDITALSDCRDYYFRFRIRSDQIGKEVIKGQSHSRSDALFHDVLSLTKVIEFRLNHSRSLPKTIQERIANCGGFLPIKRLDFFLLTDSGASISYGPTASIRRLEDNVWSHYMPPQPSRAKWEMLAYHWKRLDDNEEPRFTSWDLYAQAKIQRRNARTIAIYVLVLIVISSIGSSIPGWVSNAVALVRGLFQT